MGGGVFGKIPWLSMWWGGGAKSGEKLSTWYLDGPFKYYSNWIPAMVKLFNTV